MIEAGDYRIDLTNAPGNNSYSIVGFTWLLVHKNQKNSAKGSELKKFMKWALTDGQRYAPALLYGPLPDNMKDNVLKTVESIKS